MVRIELVILAVVEGLPRILLRPSDSQSATFVLPGGYWDGDASIGDTVEFELGSRYLIGPVNTGQVAARSGIPSRSGAMAVTIPFVVPLAPAEMEVAMACQPSYRLFTGRLSDDGDLRVQEKQARSKVSQFHLQIIDDTLRYIRLKCSEASYDLNFVGDEFTLHDLWEVKNAFAAEPMKKAAFRAAAAARRDIVATGRFSAGQRHRPAELYRPNP